MDDSKTAARWVSAWSTSPIDASLSESGVLDRLGVAVTDVSARTAVQLTAGGTHVRLTLSNVFGVLPLHVAACTVAIGADDARGIDPATLHTVTFGGERCVRIAAGTSCTSDAAALPVAAGQTLVRLDPVDARLAYERSLVALASAVRDNCRLQAQLRETEAAIRMRRVDLRQKADNLTRREALGKAKAIGAEELKHARDDRENAAVALAAAEEERNALAAVLLDTGLAEQPAVRQAAANVRDCWLALQRTTVLSPAAGQIAKRGVQAGEVVSPGTPLMTVIPLHRLWIDANFKEVQLHKMRIGQPAVIRVDMYGGDVTYHGRVTGFSAGTGSAFSLLPPQNATGNWIKIVQRVPVRIEIAPADLREHPLLVGLSAVVKVDTSDTSGRLLAASARTEPVPGDLVSQAPAVDFAPVEATISGIIRDNALPGVCPVQGKP